MAVPTALPQSISAWRHQQTAWQRACKPSCMLRGMAMAQSHMAPRLGWVVIWAQRLQVSSEGHYLPLHTQGLACECLHSSLNLHAFCYRGSQLPSRAMSYP